MAVKRQNRRIESHSTARSAHWAAKPRGLLLPLTRTQVGSEAVGTKSRETTMAGKMFIVHWFITTILESYFCHLQHKNKYNLPHRGILMSTLRI